MRKKTKTEWLNINGAIEIQTSEMEFMQDFLAWLEEKKCSFVGTTEIDSEIASDNLPSAMEYMIQQYEMRIKYEIFLKHIVKLSEGKADLDAYSFDMFSKIEELEGK